MGELERSAHDAVDQVNRQLRLSFSAADSVKQELVGHISESNRQHLKSKEQLRRIEHKLESEHFTHKLGSENEAIHAMTPIVSTQSLIGSISNREKELSMDLDTNS